MKQPVKLKKYIYDEDNSRQIIWDSSKPDGQPRRFYDMTKFRKTLGYVPSTHIEEGIKTTIDWYRKNNKWI
jgi:nucleoside-diphosphate-sugar epimerase